MNRFTTAFLVLVMVVTIFATTIYAAETETEAVTLKSAWRMDLIAKESAGGSANFWTIGNVEIDALKWGSTEIAPHWETITPINTNWMRINTAARIKTPWGTTLYPGGGVKVNLETFEIDQKMGIFMAYGSYGRIKPVSINWFMFPDNATFSWWSRQQLSYVISKKVGFSLGVQYQGIDLFDPQGHGTAGPRFKLKLGSAVLEGFYGVYGIGSETDKEFYIRFTHFL